jgi:hypothetical protein
MSSYVFTSNNTASETLFDIVGISNKNPKPDDFKTVIKDILLKKDGACYKEMEVYLRAPGVTGSKSFDQGNAVNILLMFDHTYANPDDTPTIALGTLRVLMNSAQANEREMWDKLVSVLKGIGLRFKHGRLVGAIGIEETDDSGAPDID